jgi:hypothetical protein
VPVEAADEDPGLRQVPEARIRDSPVPLVESYRTAQGCMYVATVEQLLASEVGRRLRGNVQLILTSPPFPLNWKKRYGNKVGDAYRGWLSGMAKPLVSLLKPDGSIVIEMGNAWEPGLPVMSTLGLRSMIDFLDAGKLYLCQQFVCHNPARLPSPAQWVTVERIRVKDSFTHVWWMSPSPRPSSDNRAVLVPYSNRMRELLNRGTYNAGLRPSGHRIGQSSFMRNNGGAIPPNVLSYSNTSAADRYRRHCKDNGFTPHPAPMQPGLADFFIRLLTNKQDLVFDPFAGSNTTGAMAEELGRRWIATEPDADYVEGSRGRFGTLRHPEPGQRRFYNGRVLSRRHHEQSETLW